MGETMNTDEGRPDAEKRACIRARRNEDARELRAYKRVSGY